MYTTITKAAKAVFKDIELSKSEGVIAFATYGTKDRDGDIANQGMFTKSWKEFTDVRLFKNHDKNLAPGKIIKLWDDKNHAYAHVKFGQSTLGQDTLKDIDDGIITDASYSLVPIKSDPLMGGGKNYKEVFHKEVSVLTHWGAHPESKIKAIQKAASDISIAPELLKELSSDEMTMLRAFIAEQSGSLQTWVSFASSLKEGSDLYTWVHNVISNINSSISDFKYRIQWYGPRQKEANDEMIERILKMEKAVHSSTASDEHLQEIEKGLQEIKALMSTPGSTQSSESTQEQRKEGNDNGEIELALLNLSNLLD